MINEDHFFFLTICEKKKLVFYLIDKKIWEV
jgi:hypothetical protein